MLRSFFDNLNFSFNTVGYRLTRNVEVVGSNPIKGPRCFSLFPYCLILVGLRKDPSVISQSN